MYLTIWQPCEGVASGNVEGNNHRNLRSYARRSMFEKGIIFSADLRPIL
jgi:hypothetical protein